MIVYRKGADSRIFFDWTDDEGTQMVVESATLTIDNEDESALLTLNDTYAVTLNIPYDFDIEEGNHAYELIGNDSVSRTIVSQGLLRVK